LHQAAIFPANRPTQKVAIFKPFLLISGWDPGLVRLARSPQPGYAIIAVIESMKHSQDSIFPDAADLRYFQ
jgi:hypothetical protein